MLSFLAWPQYLADHQQTMGVGWFVFVCVMLFVTCDDDARDQFPLRRTRVKVGVIVDLERRHVETRIQAALDIFNSKSPFVIIDPVFVSTSSSDALLR